MLYDRKSGKTYKTKNKYVVNTIGRDGLYHLISCAEVLHCENPLKVESDWINDYELEKEIMILLLLIRNLLQSFQRPLIWAQYIVV